MNRLQSLELPEVVTTAPALKIESGVFSRPHTDQPCALFAPLHYEPNYAYPLLVWLHGPGDDENQLRRIMPLVSLRNYVGLAVRGTQAVNTDGRAAFTWSPDSHHFADAEQRVFDAIELARERFNIAPDRVFLAGYDVGGTIAFRLALANPRSFGGVLSIGGGFPTGDTTPLRWLHDLRRLPMFLAYGRESTALPIATICETIKLFHIARLKVNIFQYPCPQQLTTKMLEDMDRWIMERVTGEHAVVSA